MNRQYGAVSGMAIALIVLNHAIHFSLQVAPVEGGWRMGMTVLQALGAFAVPAFLFVSGAFLAYAAKQVSLGFVWNSASRILWPYVIWTGAFFALLAATTDVSLSASAYFRDLLIGYPYHFVPLLLFWYLAAAVMIRAARRPATACAMLAAVALYQAALLALRFPGIFGFGPPAALRLVEPPVLFVPLSDWAMYFPLGLAISLHGGKWKPFLKRARSMFALTAAVFFLLGVLNAFGLAPVPWARFAAPLPLMFALPALDRGSIPLLGFFEHIGRRSYGIYLIHFIVLNAFVAVLGEVRLAVLQPFVAAAMLATGLAVPMLLMDVTGRFRVGRQVFRYLFGVVPPAVPAGIAMRSAGFRRTARAVRGAARGRAT